MGKTILADRSKDPAVQNAILLRKAKADKFFTADKVIDSIVGLTGITFVTAVAMRKKREESVQPLVGSKAQMDIARAQSELPPHVRERVMGDQNIVPRTLKDLRKP